MKIKKFNEAQEDWDIDYLKECFIELFDDESLNGEIVGEDDHFISFGFDIPLIPFEEEYSMEHLLIMGDSINELFKKVYHSLEKAKMKYPKLIIGIKNDKYDGSVHKGKQFVVIEMNM